MNIALAAGALPPQALLDQSAELFDAAFYLERYPDVVAAGIDPLQHFLQAGIRENRSPHPLFDTGFYAARMEPVAFPVAPEPAFLHYLMHGRHGPLDPHPLFDTAHYQAQTGSLSGQLPLRHFIATGRLAQMEPNALFDPAYYRRANGLTDAEPRHPLVHYAETGWRSGCRTHPLFDPVTYLSLRPDVARAGIDPLAHYLRHGWRETERTHALFDVAYYRAQHAGHADALAAIDRAGAIIHYTHAARRGQPASPHPMFDPAFVRARHAEAIAAACAGDPFLWFIEEGLAAGHDPHPQHDVASFRQHNAARST